MRVSKRNHYRYMQCCWAICLAVLVALFLASCGGGEAADTEAAVDAEVEATTEATSETEAESEAEEATSQQTTYASQQVADMLLSLAHDGENLALSEDDAQSTSMQILDGRVVVTQTYEIDDYTIVAEQVRLSAYRTVALAEALRGSKVESYGGNGGTADFQDVTWVVGDTHGNIFFAMTDSEGIFHTSSHTFGLLPQMGGYVLSDTVYVAIGRRDAYIPLRAGATPLAIDGTPIVAQGWLSMPDLLWTYAMPESTYESDPSDYWYRDIIEIGAELAEEEYYYYEEWW